MTTNMPHLRTLALVAVSIATLAMPSALDASELTGSCVEATIPEAFTLPDGTAVEPGSLRLCLTRKVSPAAGLHETSVDGMPVGLFPSERRTTEGASELGDALIVLRRGPDGVLVLYAYAVRTGDRMVAYRMRPVGRAARRDVRAADVPAPDLATAFTERPDGFTFLTALR